MNNVGRTRKQLKATLRVTEKEVVRGKEVKKRWSLYFEGLLNVVHDRKAAADFLGRGDMHSERVMANDVLKREKVVKALHKMKCRKAAIVDMIAVQLLKKRGHGGIDS